MPRQALNLRHSILLDMVQLVADCCDIILEFLLQNLSFWKLVRRPARQFLNRPPVGFHEFDAARFSGQPCPPTPPCPEVIAWLAMSIHEAVDVFQPIKGHVITPSQRAPLERGLALSILKIMGHPQISNGNIT